MLPPLLHLCARVSSTDVPAAALFREVTACADWPAMLQLAEAHRLAPLLYYHLRQEPHRDAWYRVPAAIRRQLTVQYLRHQRANQIRLAALRTILEAYADAHLPVLLLKGSALCHLLYPDPALRPMGDLDVLVRPGDADRAQALLARLGFDAPAPGPRWRHHHYPSAAKRQDGIVVLVEVHHHVLPANTGVSLTWETLTAPPCPVTLHAGTAHTLGYEDMLWHLCHHLVGQPIARQPLFWIAGVDILGFAARFANAIDWAFIRRRYPFVLNTLAMLSLVVPLPERLRRRLDLDVRSIPGGIGVIYDGWPAQSSREARKQPRTMIQLLRKTFRPSDWWLRLFYGLRDDQSVAFCRYVTHPAYLAKRIVRRPFHL